LLTTFKNVVVYNAVKKTGTFPPVPKGFGVVEAWCRAETPQSNDEVECRGEKGVVEWDRL
jgi:hypothetical protein